MQQTNSCLPHLPTLSSTLQRYRMSFLPPPPPGFRPPPGMAPAHDASGSRMPPDGISLIRRVVTDPELNIINYSYHTQVTEMGSDAKKKVR